jgi:hypothetical protein
VAGESEHQCFDETEGSWPELGAELASFDDAHSALLTEISQLGEMPISSMTTRLANTLESCVPETSFAGCAYDADMLVKVSTILRQASRTMVKRTPIAFVNTQMQRALLRSDRSCERARVLTALRRHRTAPVWVDACRRICAVRPIRCRSPSRAWRTRRYINTSAAPNWRRRLPRSRGDADFPFAPVGFPSDAAPASSLSQVAVRCGEPRVSRSSEIRSSKRNIVRISVHGEIEGMPRFKCDALE